MGMPNRNLSAISVSVFFLISLLLLISFFGSTPGPAKSLLSKWKLEFLAPFQPSSSVVTQQRSRLEMVELTLARARASIKEAAKACKNMTSNHQDPDYVPHGPIYRNANAFHRSYLEMEKSFKIYVYEEGEPPIFHSGPCMSIYSSEGRFIEEMEKGKFYRTGDPDEALVYFLPFSIVRMVQYLYVPGAPEFHAIDRTLQDYIDVISHRHSYWNRSLGSDHFMLSCHDWGPYTTANVPVLFNNSIRALCNANTSEGFNPSKDVSLPEINLRSSEFSLGGKPASERKTLAFYAGGIHGHIRHLLVSEWKGKDPEILVYEKAPEGMSYDEMMKESRYCLCPSGYEVASPRVVEAIYSECVPVLISDGYVPPLSDVLNWEAFSVIVPVKEIPNIKRILNGITEEEYLRKQERVKQVQRHFAINGPPQRFDIFHMMVHSIWLRRLNVRILHPLDLN
ncbi:probable glycosyltransferase At5g03795 [Impatiens glandulifera]|uniref:probable glycosyltransferase At5g03795 n=1 Tax=Impatiens glandulifera TaxID=253017 RepID=UPI001FB12903|nr:probable glycosyltransferase At5g03795 [Impatiens glandulifera]